MLDLVYSSQTEKLLEALVGDLGRLRASRGALQPVHVVVPNRNVETFLRFGIARQTGIAGNLEVHQLRRFVSELLTRGETRLVDADALRGHLLAVLLDDAFLQAEELAPVRGYLRAVGESREAIDLRRVQLAEQLARLFEEYSFSRDAMLRAWPRALTLGGTAHAETERWQRAIWLRIFGPQGLLAARQREDGIRRVHLGALLDGLRPEALELPEEIHIFGVSYVARIFQRILAVMAQRTELRVYTLNPCREFWEDVRSARELKRPPRAGEAALEQQDPFGLNAGENLPLRLWGRPGRENIRLLNELADCDFREAFPEDADAPTTLLQRLQRDILDRATPPPAPLGLEPDASVQLFACPGIRREAEAVAEEIWSLVEASHAKQEQPPLRFNEIAVIVAGRDREAYFSQLSAAFRACHDLPHNVVDLDFANTSRIAEAIELLLRLPLGKFTRPELLGVLTHPCARVRFPGLDPQQWLAWCERLEILHGADHADHAQTYIAHDVYNWDQGLRRLALGAFMTGERSGDLRGLDLGDSLYLPEEHERGDQAAAAQLAMGVRSLVADARFAREARLPLTGWGTFLAALVESHLDAQTVVEERELARCVAALRGLGELELGDKQVSFTIAHALASGAIAGISSGRGQHLADGVVVSTSQPMRAIPFRAIFLVGVGEGEFPATDKRNPLDLRAAKPQAGDVSPREQDRYMFLETLLCARERLYLSHVARNPVSGEALEPSPVVHELMQVLESSYLGAGGRKLLTRTYPLRRHELPESPTPLPASRITFDEVRRERNAAQLRASLQRSGARRPPALDELRRATPEQLWPALQARLGLTPPVPAPLAKQERIRIRINALRKFLECPLQGYAQHGLRLQDVEDEGQAAHERADEHFQTPFLEAAVRLKQLFLGQLRTRADAGSLDLAGAYDAMVELLAQSGRAPNGLFGEVERRGHLQKLESWREALLVSPLAGLPLREHRFGGAREREEVDLIHPPLTLQVELRPGDGAPRKVEVELVGAIGTVAEAPWSTLILKHSGVEKWKHEALKLGLRAYVDQLVLSAAGLHAEPQHARVLFQDGHRGLTLGAIDAAAARNQLATLAGDLLSGGHDYLLPCEAVFAVRGPEARGESYAEEVAELLAKDGNHARHSSLDGPITDLSQFAPLPDAEAGAIVERRLGSYFARLAIEEGEA